jgi:hypothetical protein
MASSKSARAVMLAASAGVSARASKTLSKVSTLIAALSIL